VISLTVSGVLNSGLNAVRAGASALASASSQAALQQLNDVAGRLSRTAAPPPIRDLLLDERLYGLIDTAIARVGLVLQKVAGTNGSAPQFYRLPTRLGIAGLIQLPGELLADGERAIEVGLIAPELAGSVSVAFVLTNAKAIAPTYKFSLWPSWKKARYFTEVRSFDADFLAFLESQAPEARLATLADNFELDLTPPQTVVMEQAAQDCLFDILLGRALEPVGTPATILRDLVDGLNVDNKAKGLIVNQLKGDDVNVVCRELLRWASALAYPDGHPRQCCYTVLGALVESLWAVSGLEQRQKLAAIAESYGLIRDRDILVRLREPGALQ